MFQRCAASATPRGPGTPFDHIDQKREEKLAKSEIDVDPKNVSSDSSVRHVFGEEGVEEEEDQTDMLAGVKQDLVCTLITLGPNSRLRSVR